MGSMITESTNDYIYVQVQNGGGYFAKFYIDYDFNGKHYRHYSGNMSLGFFERISIPGIVQNLHMTVEVWLSPFDKIIYNDYIRNYLSSCFYLYGTIFNPSCEEVPCKFIGKVLPANNLCCNNCYKFKC